MYVAISAESMEGQLVLFGPFKSLHALRKYMAREHTGLLYIMTMLQESDDCMSVV